MRAIGCLLIVLSSVTSAFEIAENIRFSDYSDSRVGVYIVHVNAAAESDGAIEFRATVKTVFRGLAVQQLTFVSRSGVMVGRDYLLIGENCRLVGEQLRCSSFRRKRMFYELVNSDRILILDLWEDLSLSVQPKIDELKACEDDVCFVIRQDSTYSLHDVLSAMEIKPN